MMMIYRKMTGYVYVYTTENESTEIKNYLYYKVLNLDIKI